MKKIVLYYPLLILLAIIFLIYFQWFQGGILTSGDSRFYFKSMYDTKSIFPYAWSPFLGNGFGGNASAYLWFYTVFSGIFAVGKVFNLSWEILDRILILYPFLLLCLISSLMIRRLLRLSFLYSVLGSIIFTTNTYILMIMGGGQKFIGLSYAIAPLIIYKVISFENEGKKLSQYLSHFILVTFLLVVQAFFDIRIAYITIFAVILFFLYKSILLFVDRLSYQSSLIHILKLFPVIFIPIVLTLFINSFWIFPSILSHSNPIQELGEAYSSISAVKYLSFARFENTISFLHPNWPLNIFGKVGFMRPEFLILPILAFVSLLFVNKPKLKTANVELKNNSMIIFFVLLGLAGSFLAKGTNDPFGGIYLWMFEKIPGFEMFRDSTKWYLLVALSYSVLIPFALSEISGKKYPVFNKYLSKEKTKYLIFIIFLIFWLFTIRFAVFHRLGGTFAVQEIPSDYFRYEKFMNSDMSFSRSLWIPSIHRFTFYSASHPMVDGSVYFKGQNSEEIVSKFSSDTQQKLIDDGIGYIVLPIDTDKQIYKDKNGYNPDIFMAIKNALDKTPWLTRINGFNKLVVYKLTKSRDLIYIEKGVGSVSYNVINPTKIKVNISNPQINSMLILNSLFDKNWTLKSGKGYISPQLYKGKYNSFVINTMSTTMILSYSTQEYVKYGLIITFSTIIILVIAYFILKFLIKK